MEKQEEATVETPTGETVPSTPQNVRGVKVETKRTREGGRKRSLPSAKKGHRCSTFGCNRTFLSMQDLIHHVSVHYKPTQSMQDKKFICSVSGCGETLGSMQELMGHLKVHYKPNRYFKCENCMQHFRTHRSLFKHLHVCSDHTARSASQSSAQPPASSDSDSATPGGRQTSVIQCVKKEGALPGAEDAPTTSTAALHGGSGPQASFSTYEPNALPGRGPGPSQSGGGTASPYMSPASYNLPPAAISQRLKPFLPAANATWKKSQGHMANSRIIWEHTRDNYRCMQCNFTTATREHMNKHIELLHKNPPNPRLDDADYDVDLLSFHPKLRAEMESDL